MRDKYLKEIAKELRLIRKELQYENEHIDDDPLPVQPDTIYPAITEQLNAMFKKPGGTNG